MGSSSERNCDARNKVPVDGFSPNCTICRRETPKGDVRGEDGMVERMRVPVAGKLL